MDALIFGYYGELLGKVYQDRLNTLPTVNEAVTAYRRIPTDIEGKFKGTMHFAKEVFSQIEDSCKSAPCSVLMFDIKVFSRIDHGLLERLG
ncbi:MAG: hypothetical protein IPH46_16570 [Bacteroidetes bacterium]|nr:hypothetical protein [Bacteroidota bacterium]